MKAEGNKYKVCDLFAGAGGLSLGAARAGFNVSGAVELDPHACAVHRQNFPQTPCLMKNVLELSGAQIKNEFRIGKKDKVGIIGGPPCQGFSVIGHMNKKDPRNDLLLHFFKIIAESSPLFFLVENVPGILSECYNDLRDNALALVSEEYDVLNPMALTASDYGIPTLRKRVFFIGFRRDLKCKITQEAFTPSANTQPTFVREALLGLPRKINPNWQSESEGWRKIKFSDSSYERYLHGKIPDGVGDEEAIYALKYSRKVSGCLGTHHSEIVLNRYKALKQGQVDRVSKSKRLRLNGYCPTLRAGTNKERGSHQAIRPIHPTQNRVITPREGARLQGFPDWFQFSPDKWHSFMQIGNSVSPILAEAVLNIIKKHL